VISDDHLAVWNRACNAAAAGLAPDAPIGDRMLMHVLLFSGMAHNGGLLHALEYENLAEAVAGLRWFGQEHLADLTVEFARRLGDIDENDLDAMEALEHEADSRYDADTFDDRLTVALQARLATEPQAFARLA